MMISKLSTLPRSRDAHIVATVIFLVALFSLSGILAPPHDHQGTLGDFVRAHKKRYSQHDEELMIRYFFQDKRDGVFLDVGCAWPIRNSTTFYLEQHLNWSGIAVDALAEYGDAWALNRPRSTFLNYAVSNESGGTITFYRGSGTGVSSIYEEHTGERSPKPPVPVEVEVKTLNDLLESAGVDTIDFMSMDIEGAEPLALAGFDIERFAPQFVCIEGRWSENAPIIREYFESHGYELMEDYNRYEKANWYFRLKPSK